MATGRSKFPTITDEWVQRGCVNFAPLNHILSISIREKQL